MLKEKMEELLNTQMKMEFYSAYLYLAMSAWFSEKNLSGYANWFRIQSQEERDHALILLDYLQKNNADIEFHSINEISPLPDDVSGILLQTLEHEQGVTARINLIMNTAIEQQDHLTAKLMQWYIAEQAEEEENATNLIERLHVAGNSDAGLLILDKECALRIYNPVTLATVL